MWLNRAIRAVCWFAVLRLGVLLALWACMYLMVMDVNGGLNGKGVNRGYVLVGNGNGLTRVGLNGDHVRLYGVVASLPIYTWLPLLTLYFALIAYILLREVERGYVHPLRDPRVLGVAILMAISINSVLVGALYIDQATPRYSLPGISVEWGFNLENSTVSAKLLLSGFYILQSATCSYSPIGANTSYPTRDYYCERGHRDSHYT